MTTTSHPAVRPEEAAGLLGRERDVRVLDVRTPAEFETAHIEGAHNIPLDTFAAHVDALRDAGRPFVVVCQSGQRARKAVELLGALDLGTCHVLEGGLNAWTGAGLPVARGRQRISLERQVRIAAGSLAALGGVLAAFVHPLFGLLPALVGGGLVFAGLTDTCGMGMLLSRLPYNRPRGTDVAAAVRALGA
jgi:rhodanese-related sulfurtransferase